MPSMRPLFFTLIVLLFLLGVTAVSARPTPFGGWSITKLSDKESSRSGNKGVSDESTSFIHDKSQAVENKKYATSITTTDLSETLLQGLIKNAYTSMSPTRKHVSKTTSQQYIFNIRSSLLGWNIYKFSSKLKQVSPDAIEIEFVSSAGAKHCRILASLELQGDTIQVRLYQVSKGVPRVHIDLFLTTISEMITAYVSDHAGVLQQRSKYLLTVNALSKIDASKKKQLGLDKIINPDKYRKKGSGNIRHASMPSLANSGGGRYKPGAAAQARRTVKSR
jgi:hypothetical protein